MTYKIKINFEKINGCDENHFRSETILLDDFTGERFIKELNVYLEMLNALSFDNNTKVKQLKYFLHTYKVHDITHDPKIITINAMRDINNKAGKINVDSECYSFNLQSN